MINQLVRYLPVINFIQNNTHFTICEVGSGSYGIGRFLDINFIGIDTTFDDYSSVVQKNNNSKMRQILASADKIPLENSSVGLIFSLDTFEHITEASREQSIKEMLRVSQSHIIIGFPCCENARKIDSALKKFYFFLKRKVPLWLVEHLDNVYPTEYFLDEILQKEGYVFSTIKNENIYF